MLVSEFTEKRYDGLPDLFYDSLPVVCVEEGCNFPMEMNETLTQLHCSNPRCPAKIVQRLDAMTKQLGVKDFGEARIAKFVARGVSNPLWIYNYDIAEDGELGDGISLDLTEKIINQFQAKKSFTLAEYVRIANIPNVQTSATAIFGDYDDILEAYEDIEKGGVPFIQSKLNIEKSEISVRAVTVYNSLMEFKNDLISSIDDVEIIKTHADDTIYLRAVVSDEVGSGFKTKAEFYHTCNNLYPNLHIEFLGSVNKSIDYLIWAGADGSPARYTNKVQKVQKYNTDYAKKVAENKPLKDGEKHISILTASDFIEELKKLME